MSQSETEIEGSYRKNLMIVAATVSMYSIAGGGFDSELAIAGAKLKFTNPQYLEYGSIIVLLFFWWRHWLVSDVIRKSFNNALVSNLVAPIEVRKKVDDLLTKKEIESRDVSGGGYFSCSYSISEMKIDSIGFFCASFEFKMIKKGVVLDTPEKISFSLFINPITFMKVNYNYRRAWLKLVLFDTRFGDAILPTVVTLIAITSYLFNYFTR
ncbi:hypothetical protein [Aeromonas veronii]|uniref:hypothetical protein n=1 Tax=Aeromonas veronii TaxID=654 RepID=UPI001302BA28|nr:hypothetical protein [Aeromonas veronii]KAE9636003.1 hypothetical protein GO977_09000 [Aeromonas veronii]